MPDPRGFLKIQRQLPPRRPVDERVRDWKEIYLAPAPDMIPTQSARCMDCGVPFCQSGCPLGNLIPEWNDLVYRERWREAIERLHATNNFPEFTGKLCPAPCEDSCVLNINSDPVTIKSIELEIIDRAFAEGWVVPRPPITRTGKRVAVVGSGPAGLAAAQQLNRSGHQVVVFERDDRIGGLLRYGIPDFKMDKWKIDRRLGQLEAEGIEFQANADVGGSIPASDLVEQFDAVVLTVGATAPRDLPIPGRDLDGIHFAMDYLTPQNRLNAGDDVPQIENISAQGKRVVIIGGGDTGADCLGTAHRQGAASIVQFQRWPTPPSARPDDNPWPQWANVFRLSAAHEEGGDLEFAVLTQEFTGRDGKVTGLRAVRSQVTRDQFNRPLLAPAPGTEFDLDADLVLLAIGFSGPEPDGLVPQLGVTLTDRGTIATDGNFMTRQPGVFAAGDARYGQSLIVTAIAEGRHVARSVDRYLSSNVVSESLTVQVADS